MRFLKCHHQQKLHETFMRESNLMRLRESIKAIEMSDTGGKILVRKGKNWTLIGHEIKDSFRKKESKIK